MIFIFCSAHRLSCYFLFYCYHYTIELDPTDTTYYTLSYLVKALLKSTSIFLLWSILFWFCILLLLILLFSSPRLNLSSFPFYICMCNAFAWKCGYKIMRSIFYAIYFQCFGVELNFHNIQITIAAGFFVVALFKNEKKNQIEFTIKVEKEEDAVVKASMWKFESFLLSRCKA